MDNDDPDARAAESLIDEWLENDRHTAVIAPVHSEAADQIDQWMIEDDAQLFANVEVAAGSIPEIPEMADCEMADCEMADCEMAEDAKPGKRRGRPKGSSEQQSALKRLLEPLPPPAERRSRKEICSAAAKAKAAKRHHRDQDGQQKLSFQQVKGESERNDAEGSAPVTTTTIVPFTKGRKPTICGASLFNNIEAQQLVESWRPENETSEKVENAVLTGSLQMVSKAQLAKSQRCSTQTITRRLRLLAFLFLLARRRRAVAYFEGLESTLRDRFGAVTPMLFLLKYKYDEMSMKLQLRQGKSQKKESVTAKLLQVQLTWSAVYKVVAPVESEVKTEEPRMESRYVRMTQELPTSIKCIESCKANTMRKALDAHASMPEFAKRFEKQTRIPIRDQHSSNLVSDLSYAKDALREAYNETLHAFSCNAHIEHRHASRCFDVFPAEKRGVLHSTLAVNAAGTMSNLKEHMKETVKAGFSFHAGSQGPGAEADDYRSLIIRHTMVPEVSTSQRLSHTSKVTVYHQRKMLLNGDYRKRGKVDHHCRGCCTSPEDCLQKIFDLLDCESGPPHWCPSRWMGAEDPIDWIQYWSLCHGLLDIAVEKEFAPKDKKQSKSKSKSTEGQSGGNESDELLGLAIADVGVEDQGDRVGEDAAEEDHHAGSDPGIAPEEDFRILDPEKDMAQEQRQATFRLNAWIWWQSNFNPRLWVYREIMRLQQWCLSRWLKIAGRDYQLAEMKRRSAGLDPKIPVVMAAEGYFTTEAMQRLGKMMREESEWRMPSEYRTHALSVQAFRGLCALACSKYELQVIPFTKASPISCYKLLSTKPGVKEAQAVAMQQMIDDTPCQLSRHWFDFVVRQGSTAENMLMPDAVIELRATADQVELENVCVETANAHIHRSIKRAVQSKLTSLEDVSSQWQLKFDRAQHCKLWGASTYRADDVAAAELEAEEGQQRGGGGLQRAFFSQIKDECRDPETGKLCFKKAWKRYYEEVAKERSEILESIVEDARQATETRKAQKIVKTEKLVSAFGVLRKDALQAERHSQRMELLANDLSSAGLPHHHSSHHVAIGDGMVQDLEESQDDRSLALVPMDPSADLGIVMAQQGIATLDAQVKALRQLARHSKSKSRRAEMQEMSDFRKGLDTSAAATTISGNVKVSELKLPAEKVVALQDTQSSGAPQITDVFVHDDICKHVSKKASVISKNGEAARCCEKLWSDEHVMVDDKSAPEIGPIPECVRDTPCSTKGAGCICSGRGFVHDLAATRFSEHICKGALKGSTYKSLLQRCFFVVNIEGTDFGAYVIVGMQYLRPKRSTVLKVELVPERTWGHAVVNPMYHEDGQPQTMSQLEIMAELDTAGLLDGPMEASLYRFVSFDRPLIPWRPDRLLTIAPLQDNLASADGKRAFWRGERFELAAEAERAALRAAAKERKDRKRDPTKAGSDAKPHRAADPQRAKKRGLRSILSAPEAAGLSMLPGSDHGHESDSLPETGAGSDYVPDSGSEGGARPGPTLPGHDDDMFSSFGDSDDDNYDRLKHTCKKPAAMPDFDDYPEHDADLEGIFDDSDIEDQPKDGIEEPGDDDSVAGSDQTGLFQGGGGSDQSLGSPSSGSATPGRSTRGHSTRLGDDTPASSAAVVRRRRRVGRGTRGAATGAGYTEDKSEEAPCACILRKYEPRSASQYWRGWLPQKVTDKKGKASRQRSFHSGLRTEQEAIDMVMDWLAENANNTPVQTPEQSEAESTDSDSE